jgi:hypothetical protein
MKPKARDELSFIFAAIRNDIYTAEQELNREEYHSADTYLKRAIRGLKAIQSDIRNEANEPETA